MGSLVKQNEVAGPSTRAEEAAPREELAEETHLGVGLADLHLLDEAFRTFHALLALPENLLDVGACESE